MPRYIDADLLMKEFCDFVRTSNNSDFANVPTWNDAVSLVGSAPTADVAEVVRCKDCKHLEIINGPHIYARCNLHEFPIISFGVIDTREWFCAYGERREDGEVH